LTYHIGDTVTLDRDIYPHLVGVTFTVSSEPRTDTVANPPRPYVELWHRPRRKRVYANVAVADLIPQTLARNSP
jgi:hypothetical protein